MNKTSWSWKFVLTAKILTAQSEKACLKISGYCSAKSGALADRTTTRDQNMYAKSGQKFNPNGYCSSKVFKVEETHTSATFRVPLDEQNKLETLMYTKGGKQWNKDGINSRPTEWGGAVLNSDIAYINENYINCINYNPKLVKETDVGKCTVTDTVTTGHYMTLDSSYNNSKIVVIPLPIHMPNGEIITSTHTALLYKPDLQIEARKTHIFPWLNKSLLSIVTFCDHGYQEVFDEKYLLILNKINGKIMMKGRRDPLSNL